MNLKQLQAEVKTWSDYNFPNKKSWEPLLGVQEELGEIAHSFLKMSQGIRGSKKEHLAKIEDGIADCVIFLCDFANQLGLDLAETRKYTGNDPTALTNAYKLLLYCQDYAGRMAREFLETRKDALNLRQIIYFLSAFSVALEIDFEQAIEKTWAEVNKRDWQKARTENGGNL